jgi:heme oxygenase
LSLLGISLKESSISASVQARLRIATHHYHVRINHHPLLVGLTGQEYPLSSYHTVLVAYFHLYAQLEKRIFEYLEKHPIIFDYSARLKNPWLADDLGFFQLDPQSPANTHLLPINFPEIQSMGELIGVLYPIEGSSLGGQVISQHLLRNHGFTPGRGARFFNGYGEKTLANWQEFCLFAETIQPDSQQCEAAELVAIQTFAKFEEVLNESYRARS